jgi:hypothetical protein
MVLGGIPVRLSMLASDVNYQEDEGIYLRRINEFTTRKG